jgi:hypothetical protein
MYRIEDIQKINMNLEQIKANAAEEYKKNYEPTIRENIQVFNVITKFIIKKSKIVYGGFAQNLLIKIKNPEDVFYKEIDGVYYNWPNLADIEFYSYTPLEDIVELTEELFKNGFKYIEGKEGVHPETYKIFINFTNYCDISYMPKNVYTNLPLVTINNFKCVDPYFMLVDAYRVLTDPLTSYWRLDKSILRFQKLLTYYPYDKKLINNTINLKKNYPNTIQYFIKKKIINKSKLIIVGFLAYNYYIAKISKKDLITDIPYYEAITDNFHDDAKKIYKILYNKYNKNITIKEYYPFFSFIDNRIEYYYNKNLILILYGNNQRCTVYKYSEKKKTYYGTFNLTLMYLFFNHYYSLVNKIAQKANIFLILLTKLWYNRNYYLESHNLTVIDKSPFQDFTFQCLGVAIDPLRASFLNSIINKKSKFKYTPTGKPVKPGKYMFMNNSGNQILNEKYLILKNNI